MLILVGGAACLVLTRRWARTVPGQVPVLGGREAPRPLIIVAVLISCLVGGGFAVARGIGGIATSAMELTGLISIDKPLVIDPTPAQTAAGHWWNILLYEPWFAAMGVCLLQCASSYAR